MSNEEEVIEKIRYYQVKLDKYAESKNYEKLIYIMSKLKKLPIKTVHLEQTGVGRTVNALKKNGGKVYEYSKVLVSSWKDMVRMEEEQNAEDEEEQTVEEEEEPHLKEEREHCVEEEEVEEQENRCTNDEDQNLEEEQSDIGMEQNSPENEEQYDSETDYPNKGNSEKVEKTYKKEVPKHVEKTHKSKHEGSNTKHHSEKKHESSSRSRKHKHSRTNEEDNTSKHQEKDRGSSKDKKSKVEDKKNQHHKTTKKSNENGDYNGKDESRHHSKKSSSESSRHESSNDNKSRHKEKESKRKHEKDSENITVPSKKVKKSENAESEEESNQNKSNRKNIDKKKGTSKSKSSKSVSNKKIMDGIDSGSGASFAEALGMCGPPVGGTSSKSTSSKKKNTIEVPNSPSTSSQSTMAERLERAKMEQYEEYVPTALKQPQLEPLNINFSTLLPEITTNYKPLGISTLDSVLTNKKLSLTDDEALSRAMKNKNQRTKVYSGNKTFGKVESLFDLCVRILQDNLDALEYTGGVPFSILKPVLQRASPDQLFNMEHHNPYLIEDTDDLWKKHCEKDFRTKKREELESWREMYMRCLQEREAKLNAITANIKQSQDKSLPVRTTKLAYVDSVVKPPRNIARKQAKNGITAVEKKMVTPSERLQQISKSSDAVKVSAPNSGSRATERGSSNWTPTLKPKKAPLMAKALSSFKNRFRR